MNSHHPIHRLTIILATALMMLPALLHGQEGKGGVPTQVALTSNLLYDALLIPSLGLEATIGEHWSVAAEWQYAWWKDDDRHRYWQTYGGDLAVRRWLGDTALTGHHLGLYAQMLTYDFELGGKGNQADKWTIGGGLEYGYSLRLTRHLNLDFSLGVGYLTGEYKEYEPQDNHYVWQATKQRHWFGPTKAEISLVWMLGNPFHRGKGAKP